MDFKYDIYISYAGTDNQPIKPKQEGWVSIFHKFLERILSELVGRDVKIAMNLHLSGTDFFNKEIQSLIENAAIFVPIISPTYIRSDFCMRELESFIEAAEKAGGGSLKNKSRILMVLKSYVPREALPESLNRLLRYEFYTRDLEIEGGRSIEFEYDGQTKEKYFNTIDHLAYDIADMLKEIEKRTEPEKEEVKPQEKARKVSKTKKVKGPKKGKKPNIPPEPKHTEPETPIRPVAAHLHSDLWTLDDQLDYSLYAKAIAEFIHSKNTNPPLTIGILAPWGQGKTTLMRLIEHKLKQLVKADQGEQTKQKAGNREEVPPTEAPKTTFQHLKDWLNAAVKPKPRKLQYPTVWFNAWKFQSREQLWAGLAHSIISDLVKQVPDPIDREKFWLALQANRLDFNKIRTDIQMTIFKQVVPKVLNLGMLLIAGLLVGGGIALVMLAKLPVFLGSAVSVGGPVLTAISKWISQQHKILAKPLEGDFTRYIRQPDYEGKMGFFSQVEQDVRQVFDLLVDREKPAVVFVDDIDRCSPGKVAEVMEAINLFLSGDFPDAYFVLGMDAQAVAASMEVSHARLSEKLKRTTRRYGSLGWYFMEKMVQLPFVIPTISDQQRSEYLKNLFQQPPQEEEADPEQIREIENRLEELLEKEPADQFVRKFAEEAGNLGKLETSKRIEIQERAIKKGAEAFSDTDQEVHTHLKRYAPHLPKKPRAIKRFVNLYRFYRMSQWARQLQSLPSATPAALGRWIVIMLRWPQLVRWIQWEGEIGLFAADSPYEKAEKIENMADKAADFSGWLKALNENGIKNVDWLLDNNLWQFLKIRQDENERLTVALEVGVW